MNDESFTGERLTRYALNIGAIGFPEGGRELNSGRISPYFFNTGFFNTGPSIRTLAEAYAVAIETRIEGDVDIVFGPAYKGISIATAIAIALDDEYGVNIGYAFNRKEEKEHGEGGSVAGAPMDGKKVLIVDDAMTSGKSADEAVDIIIANGGTPTGCIVTFDRQERGMETELSEVQEFQEKHKIPVEALATTTDLIVVLEKTPAESGDDEVGEMLNKVLEYQKEYGVE